MAAQGFQASDYLHFRYLEGLVKIIIVRSDFTVYFIQDYFSLIRISLLRKVGHPFIHFSVVSISMICELFYLICRNIIYFSHQESLRFQRFSQVSRRTSGREL
jgi:hypothetical protein